MKNVFLQRDDFYLLRNINWNINLGEHWSIIGLNGSGKTSLLRIISGYTFPSKGEVSVLGKKFGAFDLRELRKSIGWVSSSLLEVLYQNETSEEIIISGKHASIGLYEAPKKEDIIRARELLDQFGCKALSKRRYFTLSQGEKQKIILARALMNSPKLLILDEPCTGLDIFARESFLSLIETIGSSDDSPSLLYVSHHIEEILPLFGNTLLLKEGRIHSSGKTENILTGKNLTDFYGKNVEVMQINKRTSVHIKK
jgi:iron complex transport system ATP-binding protein